MFGLSKKKGDGKTSRDDKKDTRNEEPDWRNDPTYEKEGVDIIHTRYPLVFEKGKEDRYEECVYMGEKVNGVPEGKGECMHPEHMYTGEFRKGRMHGQGTFKCFGEFTYTGGFEDDLFSGPGTITMDGGIVIEGIFVKGRLDKGKVTYEDGGYYIGELYRGLPHGRGTMYDEKGTIEGEFRNGAPEGKVIVTAYGKRKRAVVKDGHFYYK